MTQLQMYKIEYELPYAVIVRCVLLITIVITICSIWTMIILNFIVPYWVHVLPLLEALGIAFYAPRIKLCQTESDWFVTGTELIKNGYRIIKNEVFYLPIF